MPATASLFSAFDTHSAVMQPSNATNSECIEPVNMLSTKTWPTWSPNTRHSSEYDQSRQVNGELCWRDTNVMPLLISHTFRVPSSAHDVILVPRQLNATASTSVPARCWCSNFERIVSGSCIIVFVSSSICTVHRWTSPANVPIAMWRMSPCRWESNAEIFSSNGR